MVLALGPYLTSIEAALYAGFKTPDGAPRMKAFYAFVREHRVKTYHCGRSLRFRVDDLDAALDPERDAFVERARAFTGRKR